MDIFSEIKWNVELLWCWIYAVISNSIEFQLKLSSEWEPKSIKALEIVDQKT